MNQIKIPQAPDAFTGPVLSGTPTGGVRAERVAAAVDLADEYDPVEIAADRRALVAAFGPMCDGDEQYVGGAS